MAESRSHEFRGRVIDFVVATLVRHPVSEVRDVYKLLYQAFLGAEHAVADARKAEEWLRSEWGEVGPDDRIPLMEPIFIPGVTPPLYRLNLAPAKAMGIPLETITEEFLRVAREFPKSYPTGNDNLRDGFLAAWECVGEAVRSGRAGLDQDEYTRFSEKMKNAGWPMAYHSPAYRDACKPHYRLVSVSEDDLMQLARSAVG
jgi:hypothetical protein